MAPLPLWPPLRVSRIASSTPTAGRPSWNARSSWRTSATGSTASATPCRRTAPATGRGSSTRRWRRSSWDRPVLGRFSKGGGWRWWWNCLGKPLRKHGFKFYIRYIQVAVDIGSSPWFEKLRRVIIQWIILYYSEGYYTSFHQIWYYENPVLPQPVFDGMKASVFH